MTEEPLRRRIPAGRSTTLPEPWVDVDEARGTRLAEELAAEVAEGHELYGVSVRVVAQCQGCDNVLGTTSDGCWFVTHLSYSRPDRPPWPSTTLAGSRDAILAEFDDHEH